MWKGAQGPRVGSRRLGAGPDPVIAEQFLSRQNLLPAHREDETRLLGEHFADFSCHCCCYLQHGWLGSGPRPDPASEAGAAASLGLEGQEEDG